MRLGTAETNSTFLNQGLALKTLLEKAGVPKVDVLESLSASIKNAQRLGAGDLDFGFMAANWIGRALRGEAPFKQPIALRMAAPMNLGPMFFIARGDSKIETMADLRGRRVSVGPATSGVAQHAQAIFGALGIDHADFTPVHLDFAQGAQALAKGEIDAQLQCPIPNPVMAALDQSTALRVLPYPPGWLEKVLAAHSIYRRTIMPKGALRALMDEVAQPGVVNVLVTHERQEASAVAAVVGAIVAGAGELGKLNPLFRGIADLWQPLKTQGVGALEFEGVPLHPGAIEAYRKAGLVA